MRKWSILVVICIGATLIVYLSVFTKAEKCCSAAVPNPSQKTNKVPEFLPYAFLFQHLSNIKDKPRAVENYFSKSGLSGADINQTVKIASEYQQEVLTIDQQAQVIIDQFHADYPPGNMPEGTAPPPPPQELIDLQAQRDGLALRYRDRLKAALGDKFQSLAAFTNVEITSRLGGKGVNRSGLPARKHSGGQNVK